jgi:hypothetical protein
VRVFIETGTTEEFNAVMGVIGEVEKALSEVNPKGTRFVHVENLPSGDETEEELRTYTKVRMPYFLLET